MNSSCSPTVAVGRAAFGAVRLKASVGFSHGACGGRARPRGELAGSLALRGIELGPIQRERVDLCRSRKRLKGWIQRAMQVRSARGLFAQAGPRTRRVAAQ